MAVYTFLKLKTRKKLKTQKHKPGAYVSRTAHVLNRQGVKTTLNATGARKVGPSEFFYYNQFEGIPNGSLVWIRWSADECISVIEAITEEDLPRIDAVEKKEEEDRVAAIHKLREERLATGRFFYETTPGIDGKFAGQLQREVLCADSTQFLQAMADWISASDEWWTKQYKDCYCFCEDGVTSRKMTVAERLLAMPNMKELFALAEPGDSLEWQEWDAGFCAASGNWVIRRDNQNKYRCNVWVS